MIPFLALTTASADGVRAARRLDATAYSIRTADGWPLVAHRYSPHGPPMPYPPVILCHGLGYNALFWDLDPACSLAEYLAWCGYDVWAVNLRGCGLSRKWVWRRDALQEALLGDALRRLTRDKVEANSYATLDPRYANWTLDDHVLYDVPALVTLVRQNTQWAEVAWVGHSLGGIVALGHLERAPNPGIARLAVIGSQVTQPNARLPAQYLLEALGDREQQVLGRPPLRGWGNHELFFNPRHVAPHVHRALTTWATDVPATGLLEQYVALASKGELWDHAGRFNYARNLDRVTVPIFIAAGAEDAIAPPVAQKYLYDQVGSRAKTLTLIGRTMGFPAEAGHNDAVVGLTSQAQFYPMLERWLRPGRP